MACRGRCLSSSPGDAKSPLTIVFLSFLPAAQREGEGVATDAPRLFLELVQALRHLSYTELWAISEERDWGLERWVPLLFFLLQPSTLVFCNILNFFIPYSQTFRTYVHTYS